MSKQEFARKYVQGLPHRFDAFRYGDSASVYAKVEATLGKYTSYRDAAKNLGAAPETR